MNGKTWNYISLSAVYLTVLVGGGYGAMAETLDEATLIATLQSDADWLAKQTACRGLRQVGTAKSVPALAALLPDPQFSHLARFALEALPCPEVDRALRDAVAKADGLPKAGIVTSIGVRRDAEAVPLLIPLLKDANMDVARAVAGALGRIGTREAAAALQDCRAPVPEALRLALDEGLLAAGEGLIKDRKSKQAAALYKELLASNKPTHVRMGAFRGLACAQPKKAPQRLIDALGGDDPLFRDLAAQLVAETAGTGATKRYARALAKLPAGGQEALLRGLAGRNDPAACDAVAKAIQSPEKAVQLAAIKALGVLGGAKEVPTLTALLESGAKEIADAAKASLIGMRREGVDVAMAEIVPGAVAAPRASMLEVLASRKAKQAVPLAVQNLEHSDGEVRTAALRVLTLLGVSAQAPAVIAAAGVSTDTQEQAAAEKALGAMAARDGADVLPVVLDAMEDAPLELHLVLLRTLGFIGTLDAMNAVLAALDNADDPISGEAVRVLSNWSSLDASPHLAKLAASSDLSRQVLGLRGYVRLARTQPSAAEKAGMLTEAMALAQRPDEQKLVLAAWGTLVTQQSLNTLLPYLKDEAVRDEAASAIVAVAGELGKQEASKAQSVAALNAVIEKCDNASIAESARKALEGIG